MLPQKTREGYNFFSIVAGKECNNYDKTYRAVMLTTPKTRNLIYFMLLASLYVHRFMQ